MREAAAEIVRSRELVLELAYRDLRIRYKQTLLGAAWAIFTPVLMMIIFTQIFARVARVDSGGVPYPIFLYCGLLPWQFFASAVKGSIEALTRNARLVTKIYMPREVFPLAQVISSAVDFLVASVVLVVMMAWYGVPPKATILFLPMVLMVELALIVALSLLVSMGNLFFRDVKYIAEVVIMLWMFVTPVVYPLPKVAGWDWLLRANPMAPIIEAYRRVLLEGQLPDPVGFGYAAAVAFILLAAAAHWFHESEYLFAERI